MNPLDDIKNITQSLDNLEKTTTELIIQEREKNSKTKHSIQVKSTTEPQEGYKNHQSYSIK